MFLLITGTLFSQVGIGTKTPNPHAVLDLESPGNDQGFLVPRLTSLQRNAINLTTQDNGLMVYDSDDQVFYYWKNTQWLPLKGTDNNLVAATGISISGNTISVVADGDGDGTNEIQAIQLSGSTLTISNNASATAIDLSPFAGIDTDDQTLSFNTITGVLGIAGGNNVTVTPTGTAGVLSGTYPNPGLADNAVTSAKIIKGAVTTTKIIDAAVTTNKLSDLAVTNGKIADASITNSKIGDAAVTTNKINDGAVTTSKFVDAAITSTKLANTGVAANIYGSTKQVPQITIDAQGRITAATPITITGVAPAGAASGDLAGSYPGPTVAPGAGNNIISAVNSASTTGTVAASKLSNTLVLDSESPSPEFQSLGQLQFQGSEINGMVISRDFISMPLLAIGSISDNGNLIVYNAVSVNGDGMDEFLRILNIENFPENTFTVFTRWGDKIFEMKNYDNKERVFRGKSNMNGEKDLVNGTYFYVIETKDQTQKLRFPFAKKLNTKAARLIHLDRSAYIKFLQVIRHPPYKTSS
ncbi:MAG: gliding motility-associated C-terminal domain-containing protein [Cyclobacteriaceae bacterium]